MLKITKENEENACLSCGEKRKGTIKLQFNRKKNGENIITFHLCRKCLEELAKEFQKYL